MLERTQKFDPRQHMQRQDFEVFHYQDPKQAGVEVHHHDFYEVYFFLRGKVEYRVEGRIFRLEPGDLLLINPMELHQPVIQGESSVYERIVLWIGREYLESLSREDIDLTRCFDISLPTHTNLLRLTSAQRTKVLGFLGEMVRERYDGGYGSELCASGIFLRFMVELNRIAMNRSAAGDREEETSPLVTEVLSYIGDHYDEELTLEGIAQQFYVSKYHLSHEFRRVVGTGVYRYIVLKRLVIARQMLSEGISPGVVCTACGFGDYANFYRAFKAQYGTGPRGFSS